jgi:hypothetical protein
MRRWMWPLALLAALVALVPAFMVASGPAGGQPAPGDIPCVIGSTHVITVDSRLVCDVECFEVDSPCIQFGRPGIKLSLNGFKLTGPASPPTLSDCVTTANFLPADGIHSTFDDVVIEGPGLVQRMRRHGIALFAVAPDFVEKPVVKKLVTHQNCFSGIWLVRVSHGLIEEIVSAKNSAASSFFPCGGTCVTNSNDNRIRRSEFVGNGSAALGTTGVGVCPVTVPNDFGVGLVGTSSGNIIEENGFGGNINGVFVCPAAAGNLIKKNVIAGNPPNQVSADNPALDPVGADVRDFSPAGANRFEENLCITYTGPNPATCATLPQFAGHQNN